MRLNLCGLVCAFAFSVILNSSNAAPLPSGNPLHRGVFKDSKGDLASWKITETDTLEWNNRPYIPVGATFTPVSLNNSAASAWQQDQSALQKVYQSGIHNLLITPPSPLVDTSAKAFQRLINELEADKFTYGIAFGNAPLPPVTGFDIQPAIYSYENPNQDHAHWKIPYTKIAAYFLMDAGNENKIISDGMAQISDGVATAPLATDLPTKRPVAMLVPFESLPSDKHLPDLWEGLQTYRDEMLAFFKQIKFGPGLRFFYNPTGASSTLNPEDNHLIPSSEIFHIEWERFIEKKYSQPGSVSESWSIGKTIHSMAVLSRLIPLWSEMHGAPYFYDAATGDIYRLGEQPNLEQWWNDFREWRTQFLRSTLDSVADTLKNEVADVPVVYSIQPGNNLLQQTVSGGVDGLAVQVVPHQQFRLDRSTGPAWAVASRCAEPPWFIAAPITGVTQQGKSTTGYSSDFTFGQTITSLRLIGMKGFFVDGIQSEVPGQDWLTNSSDLSWIAAQNNRIAADPLASTFIPHVLFYPDIAAQEARTGIVPGSEGVYWLPCPINGQPLDLWPSFSGYIMQLPNGTSVTVLRSMMGPRKVRFSVPLPKNVHIFTPEGDPVLFQTAGKHDLIVPFNREPLIFESAGQTIFPKQAATDAELLLELLLKQSENGNARGSTVAKFELSQTSDLIHQDNYAEAYTNLRDELNSLIPSMSPYQWIEGETAEGTNFPQIAVNPDASNGMYLRLSTIQEPDEAGAYAARYQIHVPADGKYSIWMAGTPPSSSISPITWYVDRDAEQPPVDTTPVGSLYLSGYMGWFKLGSVTLKAGDHALTIHVHGKAKGKYVFSIDTIEVNPTNMLFNPDATEHPIPLPPKIADSYTEAILKQRP